MRQYEKLLESYLFPDGKTYLKYATLTEAEKVSFSKSAITKLFNTIKNKSLKVNYAGLEKTKGDITKYPKYEDIENSIKILENMHKSNPDDAPMEILSCVRVLDILKKNKNAFVNAYNNKNDAIELLYVNTAAALVIGTSKLIAVTIEYIKQPNGSYKAIFKENSKTLMKDDTYFLSLNRFITMDKNGQLKQLFNMSNKMSENSNIVNEDLSDGLGSFIEDIFDNAAIKNVLLVVACIAVVIWVVAFLPYQIYRLRKSISDHLLNLAYFLEEHAYEIDTSDKKGQKVQEKQLRIVEKLKTIGNMLSLDDKQAKKVAEKDQKEDEEESRKQQENDSQNNSSDDEDILL